MAIEEKNLDYWLKSVETISKIADDVYKRQYQNCLDNKDALYALSTFYSICMDLSMKLMSEYELFVKKMNS